MARRRRRTPSWSREAQFTYAKEKFNLWKMTYGEHIGTHFDAPLHFSADGKSVGVIPVGDLVCPLAVVGVSAKAAKDADCRITIDDVRAWERRFGRIPDGACVAMRSGWDAHVRTDRFRGADTSKALHFPGVALDTAEYLIRERKVVGLVVDTLSLDHGLSKDFAVHYKWLPSGRYGIECIANLDQLPPSGATLVAGAPKFKGGSGGPGRVMALV
jgi:kynurenine formamidase